MSFGPLLIDRVNQCRFCDSECGELRSLENSSYKFPEKKYSDLLWETSRIEIQEIIKVPKFICLDCVGKLHDSYVFIKQVQRYEEQWQKFLKVSKENLGDNSLMNIPYSVDKKVKTLVSDSEDDDVVLLDSDEDKDDADDEDGNGDIVKMEFEEESKYLNGSQAIANNLFSLDDDSPNVSHWEDDETSVSNGDLQSQPEPKTALNETSYRHLTSVNGGVDLRNTSTNSEFYIPFKRKRGRPRTKSLPQVYKVNEEGRFICSLCSKTFEWRKDLYRHYHNHTQEYFVCTVCGQKFNSKDKLNLHQEAHSKLRQHSSRWLFAKLLYNDKPFILKQCKLCNETFSDSLALRSHLIKHGNTLDVDLKIASPFIQEKYPQTTNIDAVRGMIFQSLREGAFDEFYVIKNHYGFEMSLSDSDEDLNNSDDLDDPNDPDSKAKRYVCTLCDEYFPRKHLTFAHIFQKHKHENLPYKCKECKIGFVYEYMYWQHLRTQCSNKSKTHECSKCPGKFIWLESLENHKCSSSEDYQALNSPEEERQDRYECALCQRMFKYKKALFTHYEKHQAAKKYGNFRGDMI